MQHKPVEIYDPTTYVNIEKKDGNIIKRSAAWAESNPMLLKSFGWKITSKKVKVEEKPKVSKKKK